MITTTGSEQPGKSDNFMKTLFYLTILSLDKSGIPGNSKIDHNTGPNRNTLHMRVSGICGGGKAADPVSLRWTASGSSNKIPFGLVPDPAF
jgi:hypothetical protein